MTDLLSRFRQEVLESFEFLATEFGLQPQEPRAHAPELWMSFASPTTEVSVIYEVGAVPWVEIARREMSDGRPLKIEASSLELLLEERASSGTIQCDVSQPGEEAFRACLRLKAAALREFGSDILRGDFEVFSKLRLRSAENERRRNLEMFGSENGQTR